MEEKKNSKGLILVIVILIVLVLGLIGYIVYDKVLKNDFTEEVESSKPIVNNDVYEFSYKSHKLNLIKNINDVNEIYAINVRPNDTTYDLYLKYVNETETKLATIILEDNYQFEYRSLDIEDNKLYYMITSKDVGDVFELRYIDFNKSNEGSITLNKFNTTFIKDNKWEIYAGTDIYSSQIYVKDNIIYYTSFIDDCIKKYNLKTNTTESIIENVDWYDYFIDKLNNKIFYISDGNLYLSNLSGENPVELDNSLYSGSAFWTNAYYNNAPIFINPISVAIDDNGKDIDDIYVFDYSNNSFKKIKENVSNYNILHNDIKENITSNNSLDKTFFVK